MITVMGATGHTGEKITTALLATGHQVRALGRSDIKLAPLAAAGAEVRTGDAADVGFLTDAFRGSEAVYTLLPTDKRAPDYYARQQQEGVVIAEAIRASGVRYVVALSSLGTDRPEGTGLIMGLRAQEERLTRLAEAAGVNVLLLRPVSFFENFYDSLPLIAAAGINGNSVIPDLAVPMVATSDVAAVATQALADRDWTGVAVRELLGPRDLSYAEATRIIGERIGRPDLAYVQFSYAEMAAALVEAGLSARFAGLYVDMTHAFNQGWVQPRYGRTPANTTPTRFEDFASDLAVAFLASVAA